MKRYLLALCATFLAPAALAQSTVFSQVERGRYVVATANCRSCHTAHDGEPFAGGRGLHTPFGTIYTPNITFDQKTGLGLWTKDQFYRALHEGISRDGSQLYPAFPYPHFTKMPREDVDAAFDYLATQPRIAKRKPDNELWFPLGWRRLVAAWNVMFFRKGVYTPDPTQTDEWNRGAYLVQGPSHCGGCHTEKNLAGADKEGRELMGGTLENWAAPNIRGGRNGGLQDWTKEEIVTFLKTGRNAHTAAMTRMGEVITYSTQHMTKSDLGAIATYLKSLESPVRSDVSLPEVGMMRAGGAIYADSCSACHGPNGTGVSHIFARLAGSNKLNDPDATTVIRIVLEGARATPTAARPTPFSMPAYHWKLTDDQIASVISFVRASWGNKGEPVSAGEVSRMREKLQQRHDG